MYGYIIYYHNNLKYRIKMENLQFNQDELSESDSCNEIVIIAWNEDKLVLVRKIGMETWELPCSELIDDETATDAAERVMYEQTGAEEFQLYPITAYTCNEGWNEKSGMLYTAEILDYDDLPPESEVEEILLFDELPDGEDLTQPFLHPELYKFVLESMRNSVDSF
jgi:8-oxo-dGTP diphosphatase